MFFKQFAEVVCVVIPNAQGNVLNAGILLFVQQKLCLFHSYLYEVVDRGVTGFAFKYFGYVKGAQVHVAGYLVEGYFFIVVAVQVVNDLFHDVFFVGGFKFVAVLYAYRCSDLLAVEEEDHLGDVGFEHEVAPGLAAGALCFNEGAEAGKSDKGLFTGADEAFVAGEEDLVAFHVPYVDVGKCYVGFFQGGIRIYVGAVVLDTWVDEEYIAFF